MKKTILSIFLMVLVALSIGCTPKDNGNIGLPNPASVYCEDQGGNLIIKEGPDGQYGECTLKDGTICEEWSYYRGECPYKYDVVEKLSDSCTTDSECTTPVDYLVRSSCPYTSKCLDKFCTVVCPKFNGTVYPNVKDCGSCPEYSPPAPGWCKDGKIVPGVENECGCTGHPTCEQKACTEEAKLCPDGSAVGRTGPNCEFAECPSTTSIEYVSTDLEKCKVIRFMCVKGKEYFSDDKGCGCKPIEPAQNECTIESRKGEFCSAQYEPVCGWFDGAKIQCIAYPCAQTFSNSCNACHNDNVAYWTTGECPNVGSSP
jgi:putative hemolysin